MSSRFRRVLLIGKPGSAETESSLKELTQFLRKQGCEVLAAGETRADLAIVVGGDGTMLGAARDLVRHHVPLVGINQGRLGFMTDIGHADMFTGVTAILEGHYSIEERTLLDAEITRGGASHLRTIALNEAVIGKGSQGRLIEFELSVDGEFVYRLRADGIIVATPTGSTAYSLSAGGPVVVQGVEGLVVTPICAHTLAVRPLVVRATSTIVVEPMPEWASDVLVSFDGQTESPLAAGERVEVRRADGRVRIIRLDGENWFARMQRKLHWGDLSGRQEVR